MRRYQNDFRWITPTADIFGQMEVGDMVKFQGTVTSVVDIRYDVRKGEPYLALATGDEVSVLQVEVIEGHYIGSQRRVLAAS